MHSPKSRIFQKITKDLRFKRLLSNCPRSFFFQKVKKSDDNADQPHYTTGLPTDYFMGETNVRKNHVDSPVKVWEKKEKREDPTEITWTCCSCYEMCAENSAVAQAIYGFPYDAGYFFSLDTKKEKRNPGRPTYYFSISLGRKNYVRAVQSLTK